MTTTALPRPRTVAVALVAVLVLFAGACGDADPEEAGPPLSTVAPGRGWLEGDDLDWTGPEGGEEALDHAPVPDLESSTADAATEGGGAELRAPEPDPGDPIDLPVPPVDDSPLRAGSIDDADDVAAFLAYRAALAEAGVVVRPLDLADTTVFTVTGSNGLPVLDATVELWAPDADRATGEPVVALATTADGSVRFSPGVMAPDRTALDAVVRVGDLAVDVAFAWGEPAVAVVLDTPGGVDGSVPVDVHFVLDATGSMSDEIARLRDNMTAIANQIAALPSAPDVRFGMTVYRDEGDLFVTRTFDLTTDLESFLGALADVVADGGGDYPEAMDEALADALTKPAWRRDGAVQLMFVIADAPPQVGRQVDQPYTATAAAAAMDGVKIFPVAASGTDDQAEAVMRDLAFTTGGRFVFLSYGVGGAAIGEQSDITADDYDELPLDQLVVRLVEDEITALTGGGEPTTSTTTTTVPDTTTTYEQ